MRCVSSRWKAFALLFPIVGMAAATAFAQGPGSQRAFFQAWWGVASGVFVPTDYLHFWNPAVTGDTDQGPGGNDADSVSFDPDSADGWNMGTDNGKYITLNNAITNGSAYTITLWIKPDITAMNANTFGGWIINERNAVVGSNSDFQFLYGNPSTYGSQQYRAQVFNSAGSSALDVNTNVADNVWQHFAVVVNPDTATIELFVDGVSDGSSSLSITPNDSFGGTTSIGAGWSPFTAPDKKYHGSIGKVRFYQRALTQSEIQAEIDADGGTGP